MGTKTNAAIFFTTFLLAVSSVWAQVPDSGRVKISAQNLTSDLRKVEVLATDEDRQVVAEAISNLEFEYDQATIHPNSHKSLKGLADWLKPRQVTLKVAGHADEIGTHEYNMNLSRRRATAVRDFLVDNGADPKLVDPIGYGESQPIMSNGTEEGRQKNRRVEFILY